MTIHLSNIEKAAATQAAAIADTKALYAGQRSYSTPFSLYRNVFKRCLDVTAVLISLPIVLPLIAIAALLIIRDGSSPFYRQKRLGMNGRVFRMWKLRTMVINADEKLEAHLSRNTAARREWDAHQKLKFDPRITPIGRVLRKTSLDELPQLFNVLSGDMSLVGPRPMMVCQRDMYPGTAYYHLRPGITGLWQISDRNECSFAKRADFDAAYEKNLSLPKDLLILSKTVSVVLRGTGH